MSSGHSFRSFKEFRKCGRMQTRIDLYINASTLLNGSAFVWVSANENTCDKLDKSLGEVKKTVWRRASSWNVSAHKLKYLAKLRIPYLQERINLNVIYISSTCHPHFCKLAHISLLLDSCKSGTQANDYCTDISYLCTNPGRTEFMHLLNGLNSKQLSSYTLSFPLEILKFYHLMSLMTPAIVVINSCCICCWLSDFIFV